MLFVDVELNHGLNVVAGKGHLHELHFGCINVWFAIYKTALIHITIAEQNLKIMAVTETYVKFDHPAAIYNDSALDGYTVSHLHKVLNAKTKGSGIGLISRESLRACPIGLVKNSYHSRYLPSR